MSTHWELKKNYLKKQQFSPFKYTATNVLNTYMFFNNFIGTV